MPGLILAFFFTLQSNPLTLPTNCIMKYLFLAILASCSLFASAQQGSAALRSKTITLRRFLEQNHYQPLQWNDSSSVRLYDRWLEQLDDEKLLFSSAEISQLVAYKAKLDDELMGREWNFYDKSTTLYKLALIRADSVIKSVTEKPLDFAKPGNLSWPLSNYATGSAGIYQLWQQYIKWKVLRSIADVVMDSTKKATNYTEFPSNFATLEVRARRQVRKQELQWVQNKLSALSLPQNPLEDDYLEAISWCYDPHTQYMNAAAKADFDTEMSGLEYSTGFEMDENEKGEWEITYLVPGGPAWRNGELHKGDVILKIKSGNQPELALADASREQLGSIMAGSSNEQITITVRTVSGAQKTAVLAREKITNEEGVVKSYIINGPKKVGYITLPGFYVKEGDEDNTNGCSNDVAKEVVKLKKDSIAGLILDLRFNGGGSLMEALELAGIFISEGSLTSTRDKTGKVHFLRDPNRGTIYDGPLLVMVNTLSASASELVSAVLQDYHRALIVGSATYGKGSAQVILPMDTSGNFSKTAKYDSYVKVTTGKFYRVDGSTTQWKGVLPDIELPDMYAMDRFREKSNVSALQPDLSKTAIYQPLAPIPFAGLKTNSAGRVAADPDFKAIEGFIDWSKGMSKGRTIPLQWLGYINYYKSVTDRYAAVDAADAPARLKAVNNSLDQQRQQLTTEQSKAVNDINIKRIEKDSYIAECYKVMMDWLK